MGWDSNPGGLAGLDSSPPVQSAGTARGTEQQTLVCAGFCMCQRRSVFPAVQSCWRLCTSPAVPGLDTSDQGRAEATSSPLSPHVSWGRAHCCHTFKPRTLGLSRWSFIYMNDLFGKIPWRRKWQRTPVFLPGKFHGQRSLERRWDTVHRVTENQTRLSNGA